jgi:hypothetical protein
VNYVLDGLRTEFPSFFGAFARVHLPPLRREAPFWAFLSAHGAALVVGGILHIALLAAPRSLTDPVIRWPFGATLASMITFVASVVAGAVLVRAGGSRAIALYAGFALLQALAQLPFILRSCGQLGNDGACNVPFVYIAAFRAPEWLGVAIGIIVGLRMGRAAESGPNRMLRGAGAFGLALFALMTPLSYAAYGVSDQQLQAALFVIAYALVGVIAGLVLRDARPAAAVLVALVIVAPALGLALPLVRNAMPGEPIEFTVTRLASLLAPAAAGACLLGAWLLARRRLRS